jgi:hypothetical protein
VCGITVVVAAAAAAAPAVTVAAAAAQAAVAAAVVAAADGVTAAGRALTVNSCGGRLQSCWILACRSAHHQCSMHRDIHKLHTSMKIHSFRSTTLHMQSLLLLPAFACMLVLLTIFHVQCCVC